MAKQPKADLETEVMERQQRFEKLEALLSESFSNIKQAAEASPSTVQRRDLRGSFVGDYSRGCGISW